MSLIFLWQESKSESLACGGGGRPTMPPVVAERNITSHALETLTVWACSSGRTEHNTSRARVRGTQQLRACRLHRPSQHTSSGTRPARDCPECTRVAGTAPLAPSAAPYPTPDTSDVTLKQRSIDSFLPFFFAFTATTFCFLSAC